MVARHHEPFLALLALPRHGMFVGYHRITDDRRRWTAGAVCASVARPGTPPHLELRHLFMKRRKKKLHFFAPLEQKPIERKDRAPIPNAVLGGLAGPLGLARDPSPRPRRAPNGGGGETRIYFFRPNLLKQHRSCNFFFFPLTHQVCVSSSESDAAARAETSNTPGWSVAPTRPSPGGWNGWVLF